MRLCNMQYATCNFTAVFFFFFSSLFFRSHAPSFSCGIAISAPSSPPFSFLFLPPSLYLPPFLFLSLSLLFFFLSFFFPSQTQPSPSLNWGIWLVCVRVFLFQINQPATFLPPLLSPFPFLLPGVCFSSSGLVWGGRGIGLVN